MKIGDALAGVTRLYIETAPFIYYVEDHPVYADKVESVLDAIRANNLVVVTSVITLAETLTKLLKNSGQGIVQVYRKLLQETKDINLLPITAAIAERTANLRARYNLHTPDALHLAAALKSQCDTFLTNDLKLRRVTELRVIALDDLDLA